MPEADLLELFVRPLADAGIKYLVSGSMAAMLYGEPRVTHDVDLIVTLRHEDIPRLIRIFPESSFYVPPPMGFLMNQFARLENCTVGAEKFLGRLPLLPHQGVAVLKNTAVSASIFWIN